MSDCYMVKSHEMDSLWGPFHNSGGSHYYILFNIFVIIIVTLSAKTSLMLGVHKAGFRREGQLLMNHILLYGT